MRIQHALLVFLGCGFLHAQNTPPKARVVSWNLSDPRCTVIYSNGVPRERFSDNGHVIDVWAPQGRDKHTYTILVGIQNRRKEVLDVNPANMGALTDQSPQVVMSAIDGDALIAKENKSAHRRAMFGNAMSGFAAGYGSNTTATAQNSNGSTTTVTVHNPGDVSQAERDAANNGQAINASSATEASGLLRRNTVGPEAFALGRVYVEKPKAMPKTAHIGSFVVDLGDVIYIFPFANEKIPAR